MIDYKQPTHEEMQAAIKRARALRSQEFGRLFRLFINFFRRK